MDLPIIGIIKRDYENSDVRITATLKEIDELYNEGVDVIAFDATSRIRPDGKSFDSFFLEVREKYPNQLFMADVSTVEEAIRAESAGVDGVAPTLAGYTYYSKGAIPLQVLEEILKPVSIPVIAEGNFDTPEKAQKAVELGAHAVVVGSAITRPQVITGKFVQAIEKVNINS